MSETVTDLESASQREQLLACFKSNSSLIVGMKNIPEELLIEDEVELKKRFNPTPIHYALKKKLWSRFYEVQKTGEFRIKLIELYDGICTDAYFFQTILKNPVVVAWLTAPPVDYHAMIEEAFRFSFEKVRDGILNMPITEKTAPILLKAFQYFADRHLGPVVQRIESKNLNVEVDGNKPIEQVDPHEIDAKLRELKAKLIPSRDVTSSDD